MSLVVSSTTDSQEDVNAAAGLADAGEAETTESTTPVPKPAEKPAEKPEENGDDDNEDENGDDPEELEPKPKRKGGFQRKIEALERERERERWYAQKQIEQLQAMLAGQQKPAETPQPQASKARPTLDQFQDYDVYVEAVADWKTEQKIAERERELARQAREWHAQEQQRQLMGGWQQRVGEFRSTAGDFDETLAAVEHIEIPPEIQRALIESEDGPRLAYALAKEPKELARIARIESPRAALRELGKFEARISAQAEQPQRPAFSRPPEPIRPVGGGAATSTKPVDEMSYQEYKAYREREIAAKKRRSA